MTITQVFVLVYQCHPLMLTSRRLLAEQWIVSNFPVNMDYDILSEDR
eukprot:UN13682